MQTITHYEVYQANGDQWALAARYAGRQQDNALTFARALEEKSRIPVAVIEENESPAENQFDIRLIHRTALPGITIRPPSSQNDIASRMLMVVFAGLALGAVAATVLGTAASGMLASGGQFNVIILGAFLIGSLLGGALIFRLYVPVGLVLWNAKDPESRKRTILTLTHGAVVDSAFASAEEPASGPGMTPEASAAAQSASDAGGFETTETAPSIAAKDEPGAPPSVPADAAGAPVDASSVSGNALEALLVRVLTQLAAFTDKAMAEVTAARPTLAANERQAINLYLAGAAQTAADRNVLDQGTTSAVLRYVLERSGLALQAVEGFVAELDGDAERPRFRRMIDSGAAALAASIDGPSGEALPTLNELLTAWNDPTNQAGGTQQVTLLLTDIAGSTALTSQIGNAGAQRVVRAHNAIVRAAAKAFKGREVKHTGDGILLLFPDPAGAARAAMDIQQEATNYAKDNPAAPLVLRVGVHQGDAVFEDGDYYGTAVAIVNGVCGVVGNTEIGCTASIRKKVGSAFRFEDMGVCAVKGSPTGIEVAKLLWEPKRSTPKPIEYRQIGTAPPGRPETQTQ